MGLIKSIKDTIVGEGRDLFGAGAAAIRGVLGDKYKDIIECSNMENNILMMKKSTSSGRISRDSAIIVQPGQMVVIVDSGKVVDAAAEEGTYIFDESSTPTFLGGDFKDTLKDMWERFTFGGASPKHQEVYYFNVKEIFDNGFGTQTPVPYKDWDHATANARTGGFMAMSVNMKCRGKYTFKIENPALFMREVAGTANIYEKAELTEQIRSEVIAAFSLVLNSLGSDKYRVGALDVPSQALVIKNIMDENEFDRSIRNRGLRIVAFTVESVTLDDASMQKINDWEASGDLLTQQARLNESYGQAMVGAANNANGAATGFTGIGLMNLNSGGVYSSIPNSNAAMLQQQQMQQNAFGAAGMAAGMSAVGGMNAGGMFGGMPAGGMQPGGMNSVGMTAGMAAGQMAAGMAATQAAGMPSGQAEETTTCPTCNAVVKGKFCSECGTRMPEVQKKKFCSNCGSEVQGKFCSNCGTSMV